MSQTETVREASPRRAEPRAPRWPWIVVGANIALLISAVFAWAGYDWCTSRPDYRFQKGVAAIKTKDRRALRREAIFLEEIEGYSPHSHLLLGVVKLLDPKPSERTFYDAIQEFDYAHEHDDTRALALVMAAESYYHLGQYADSERLLLAALEDDNKNVEARRWLAAVHYDLGAYGLAVQNLDLLTKIAPEDARPWRLLGMIHEEFLRYEAAIDSYRGSLKADPEQPDQQAILFDIANCHVELRKYREALEILAGCKPTSEVYALSADCHDNLGDAGLAKELIEKSLKLDRKNMLALILKGNIALSERDFELADEALSDAVRHHPHEVAPRTLLATACKRLGQDERAVALLDEAEAIRKLRDRYRDLQLLAFQDTYDAEVRFELASIADKLGMPDAAVSWLKATLAVAPGHPDAVVALRAKVEKSRGLPPSENQQQATSNQPLPGA